jgi:hypothetical protein
MTFSICTIGKLFSQWLHAAPLFLSGLLWGSFWHLFVSFIFFFSFKRFVKMLKSSVMLPMKGLQVEASVLNKFLSPLHLGTEGKPESSTCLVPHLRHSLRNTWLWKPKPSAQRKTMRKLSSPCLMFLSQAFLLRPTHLTGESSSCYRPQWASWVFRSFPIFKSAWN